MLKCFKWCLVVLYCWKEGEGLWLFGILEVGIVFWLFCESILLGILLGIIRFDVNVGGNILIWLIFIIWNLVVLVVVIIFVLERLCNGCS